MGTLMRCSKCGKQFYTEKTRSVGTSWRPGYAAICPECGTENRFALDIGSFDVDRLISNTVDEKYEAKKHKTPIEERVKLDAVREYWVQQYIAANYEQLGFTGLEGPFDCGPDFRVLQNRKWILAEAEVVCENYIKHKHHENPKWASCAILIVLSEKKPVKETKKYLPKTIIHIDKAHFTEWYRTAAKEYALAREKEEPAKKTFAKANWKLKLLATEIRKRFGVPYDENGGDDMRLFDDLAFDFVVQWMTGKGADFKLAEVTPEAIDAFCGSVAAITYKRGCNMPVCYSLYCKKCDKTLVIRASRMEGYSDYKKVLCPHCQQNLGEIRADMGFETVAEKKGNHGNSQWQGHHFTQAFIGEKARERQ